MMKKKWLIFAAVAGFILMLAMLMPAFNRRESMLVETAETRRTVEDALDTWLPKTITAASDPAVLEAARNLSNAPYVARFWVVDQTGTILFHHDGPGKEGDSVRTLAGRDGRALVGGLPSDVFSGPQAIQIYTAAALMADGDHNDVFRPLIRPLVNGEGRTVGVVGVSYDVSPEVSNTPLIEVLTTLLFLLGLGIYWLALPLWVFLDARQRSEPALLWAVFTLAANLVGLVAYLIVVNHAKFVSNSIAR